jgi:ribosomal protein S18 acetylase RimI-like enzyme
MRQSLEIREATSSDNQAICQLMEETVMGNSIQLSMERSPDYFMGSATQVEQLTIYAAFERESKNCVGLFSAGQRSVYLNGEPSQVRYLSDLRIHPDYRSGTLLAKGFRILEKEVFQSGEFAQTLVLEDNVAALKLLESKRACLPTYHPAGRYASVLLPRQRIKLAAKDLTIRRAKPEDLPQMQNLLEREGPKRQFFPCLRFEDMESHPGWRGLSLDNFLIAIRNDKIVGFVGCWNQSEYKRIQISRLSTQIKALRPFWNIISKITNRIPLPAEGAYLNMNYLTLPVCLDWNPDILRALLSTLLKPDSNKSELFLLGLDATDPLIQCVQGLNKRIDYGRHYLAGFDSSNAMPSSDHFYFDPGRI